ncbi:hypothetical protein ACA910_013253 [Epithemia clementina (nom. ined.)]
MVVDTIPKCSGRLLALLYEERRNASTNSKHRSYNHHRKLRNSQSTTITFSLFLVLSALLVLVSEIRQVGATLLPTPQVHWRVSPPSTFSGDFVAEGNGVVIDSKSDHAYITTLQGRVLDVSLKNSSVTKSSILFETPSVVGFSTTCLSNGVLYGGYIVFAVMDSNVNSVSSRVLLVPTNFDRKSDRDFSTVRTIHLQGLVKGTPLINPDGHLFVVHDLDNGGGNLVGRLSIFDLNNDDAAIASLPDNNSAYDARVLSPPTMTRVTLDDGSEADWIVMGENVDDGSSNVGNLYAVRFDPSTNNALWHSLSVNIGGSTKKAPAVSADGTTIVIGLNRNTVVGWVNNANIRAILHYGTDSTENDVPADFESRLSRDNQPVTTQPVLMGSHVLVAEQSADTLALDLFDGGNEDWRIDSFTTHVASPVVITDADAGQFVVYDLSQVGILRQVVVEFGSPSAPTETYAANCAGFIEPSAINTAYLTTQSECGSSAMGDFAVSPDGAYLVYATANGIVTALQVEELAVTQAPSPSPSTAPTVAPSIVPSTHPTLAPTARPTTVQPVTSKSPSQPPVVRTTPDPTASPTKLITPAPTKQSVSEPTPAPTKQSVSEPTPTATTSTTAPTSPKSPVQTAAPSRSDLGLSGVGGASTEPDSSSGNSLSTLAIALGGVAGVLFCVVLAAVAVSRRKRKDDKEEKARLEREMEVQKSWQSNKRQYEEEMRLEEEETLNDLHRHETQPDKGEPLTAAAPLVLPPKKRERKSRRLMGRKRAPGVAANSTLGSISESENEQDSFVNNSDTEESGFEVSVDTMEQGSTQGETTYCESSFLESPEQASPPSRDVATGGTALLLPMDESEEESPQHELDPASPSSPNPNTDNQSKWFAEILALRSSLFDSKPKVKSNTATSSSLNQQENAAEAGSKSDLWDGRPVSPPSPQPIPPPPAGPPPDDEEEPGIIPLVRKQEPQKNVFVPRVLTPPTSPIMDRPTFVRSLSGNTTNSPSDLVSVDSSLYLEGSTIASNLSPPGGGSVVSLKSGGAISTKSSKSQKSKPSADGRLSPPGGGSVLSLKSEGSQRSAAPGAHYLASGSSGEKSRVTPVSNRSLSPAPDELDLERSASPTAKSFVSGGSRRALVYEQGGSPRSPRGATVHVAMLPQYQSRAGLFSRRQRPMDRLLPQYESDATASASENEADDKKKRKPPSGRPVMPEIQRMDDSVDSLEPDSASSPDRSASGSESSRNNSSNVWNSFLSELSKAEKQFFNPALSSNNDRKKKPREQQRPMNRDPSPDPPPPPSRRGRQDRDESPEPPPPPPMYDEERASGRRPSRGRSRGPSHRRLAV